MSRVCFVRAFQALSRHDRATCPDCVSGPYDTILQGTIRAWDLEQFLVSSGCHPVPEESLPRSMNNYDIRRRFHRQVKERDESENLAEFKMVVLRPTTAHSPLEPLS